MVTAGVQYTIIRHIRPRWVDEGGITGEFSVSDYGVFLNIAELAHVSNFWNALVTHALTVDEASSKHAEAPTVSHTGDPEYMACLEEQQGIAKDAHFYLTRASLLSLIAGFVEFCLIEAYQLVFGSYPAKERPDIVKDVIQPMESTIGELKLPDLYVNAVLLEKSNEWIDNGCRGDNA